MKELEYPFDSAVIMKKKKAVRRELLEETEKKRIPLRIAVLGGCTTNDIVKVLELFLLNYGIAPAFYESEYNRFFEDAMFQNPELEAFSPELIFLCTCNRNITAYPSVSDSAQEVSTKLDAAFRHFETIWERLAAVYQCPIVQNNFEYPLYRLMGSKDASDFHGKVNFITKLNLKFYEYAQAHQNFYIHDINYESASYGLEKWSDPFYWHSYKYAVAVPAIPYFSYNVANLIKSLLGRNKKVLMLDCDNTLWGGVIGDDGADNIDIGQETAVGQTFSEFQEYCKELQRLGVLLAVNSKNDAQVAQAGFERPDSVLKKSDFVSFQANWNPKDRNLLAEAKELNLLPESFVFVDDNPAEREIIRQSIPEVSVPELSTPEYYLQAIDKAGYFEVTNLSADDLKRNDMYQANARRVEAEESFADYNDYLISLEMQGEIHAFAPLYFARIAQLTNKSNQFNLTTKRYTQAEIEQTAKDPAYVTLYGKLQDKFGDNGVVSVVIGKRAGKECHIDLWIMSCRVLKRNMEFAMMDALVDDCQKQGIRKIVGYYYPTAKNKMVKEFYGVQGFCKTREDDAGNAVWEYEVPENAETKNHVIRVNEKEQ